ncbi:MAG: aspartate kinase [Thermoflexales bacterium]|nr:aspartate kinase [Thermoflexales bacterium]
MSLLVMKFGGTSVGDATAMRQVARITRDAVAQWDEVVVVTSAMGRSPNPKDHVKVTDALLNAARAAAAGDDETYRRARRELSDKHHAAIEAGITSADERRVIGDEIDKFLDGFEMLCASVRVLGEATPRAMDAIAGLGERMAARVLAGVIRSAGVMAESIDATETVVTNNAHQNAAPLMDLTRERTRARLRPLLEQRIVPVVTGYVGATLKGVPTTLGRGGSDFSASLVADALDASEVHNFSDVDGVLTTDPRIAPDARTIDILSATEMSEMAFFGAQVLHPLTILPLVEKRIPLRVKNTFNPSHPGTLIVYDAARGDQPVKSVSAIADVAVITVTGRGMQGVAGIAGRTFTAVARTGTSVYMFSQASAEQNICLVVPRDSIERVKPELDREFAREIYTRDIDAVTVLDDAAIVTAVGSGIAETPGVSGRVFSALGDRGINIIAIAQGSSECGISLVVKGQLARDAVRAVHSLIV